MEEIIWKELTVKKHILHILWTVLLLLLFDNYVYRYFADKPVIQIIIISVISVIIIWLGYIKWLFKSLKIIYNHDTDEIYTVDIFNNKRNVIMMKNIAQIFFHKFTKTVDDDPLDDVETIEFYDKNNNVIFKHKSRNMEFIIEFIKNKNNKITVNRCEIIK